MVALRTLVDQSLSLWHVVAHPVLEVSVAEVSEQQLSALECSLAQWTVLSDSGHLELFQHGQIIAVRSAHLLIEHLDHHLVGDAPVSDHGDLVTEVLTTQWTLEWWSLRQLPGKPLHEVFVSGVSHQDLNIATHSLTALHWTLVVNIIRLGTTRRLTRAAHVVIYPGLVGRLTMVLWGLLGW